MRSRGARQILSFSRQVLAANELCCVDAYVQGCRVIAYMRLIVWSALLRPQIQCSEGGGDICNGDTVAQCRG